MAGFSKKEFGRRLRKRRVAAGFTRQQDLAEAIGATIASISYYESGDRIPDAESLAKIAQVLHCSTDYLTQKEDAPTHEAADIVEATGLSHEAVAKLLSAEISPHFSVYSQDNYMGFFLSELICSEEILEIISLCMGGSTIKGMLESGKVIENIMPEYANKASHDEEHMLKLFKPDDKDSFDTFKKELLLAAAKHKVMDAFGKFFDILVASSGLADDIEF